MKVLWLARHAPLPNTPGGDAVYSGRLIAYLAERVDVEVLTFDGAETPKGHARLRWHQVAAKEPGKVRSLVSPLPSVAYRFRQQDYVQAAKRLAAGADIVVVDHIGLMWMVQTLKAELGTKCPPVVVINHDHEASLRADMVRGAANPLLNAALRWDGWKAGRLELAANRAADGFTAITEGDMKAFRSSLPGKPALLLMPGYEGHRAGPRTIDSTVPRRIVILGGRRSFHKQAVLRMILDAVDRSGLANGYIFDVVGGDGPGSPLSKKYPKINFLGFLEQIEPYFATARIGLIPDELGGGFKLRALTHIFNRVPMLALTKALAGMTLRENVDFIGVDTIDQMVQTVPKVIDNFELLNQIQNDAFAHCDANFNWSDRARSMVDFFESLRGREGRAAA